MLSTHGTYYYKDRDARSQTIYILIFDGRRVGQVKTKREAQAWFRANNQNVGL